MGTLTDRELEDLKQELLIEYADKCDANLIEKINEIQHEQLARSNESIREPFTPGRLESNV